MRNWTKTAGLLFLATSAVYSNQLAGAATAGGATDAVPVTAASGAARVNGDVDPFAEAVPVEAVPVQPAGGGRADVRLSDMGTVEIHVSDANLVEVLRMLALQSQKNIVASREVRGTVTANLYDVTVREALDAILLSNGYAYQEKGNFIYVYTQRELEDMEQANRVRKTEVFHLHYVAAEEAEELARQVLSGDARTSYTRAAQSGIAFNATEAGGDNYANGNVLVVTDYPENLAEVRRVLRSVDVRPQQVLVEATILRARLTEDNALGVDFTVLGGINFNRIEGAPAETRRSAMTGNIVDADGAGRTGYTAGGTTFPQAGVDGLKVGIVYNNVAAFISALEQVTDTVVVANPKVLTVNKQKGEVLVGRQDGYPVLVQREHSTVQDVKMLDSGTKLVFRPFIGNDGYIRLEVHPEDSIGQVQGGLPIKQTTEVTANVMVRDGHTIVIGGLFREQSESMRDQVPYLGNIPVVGNLFRSRRDRTTREEVIILLTPHIVKDDVAYSRFSEEQLQSLERMRVGVRRGMMPWGRERLAESSYNRALAELDRDRPNRRRALWHLNGATNLNPTFTEAMDLKVTLTGEEITSVDGSSIRHFVRQQILAERAAGPVAPPAQGPSMDEEDVQDHPVEQPQEPRRRDTTERVEERGGRSWPFALRATRSALGAAGSDAEAQADTDDLTAIETVVGADRDEAGIELIEEPQPAEEEPVIVDIQAEPLDSFYIPLNDSK